MTTRRLTWRGKAVLAILSPIVFCGLVEIVLRIAGFRYEPWVEALSGRNHEELRQGELFAPDPDLIWTLKPSSILDLPGSGFFGARTNSSGLRGPELPTGPSADEFRVLCLGESVTFGTGLADGDTWPERMEEALRESPELAGRTVRVVNGGVPGWTSVQGLRLFDRLAFLKPDAVVFWYGFADSHPMRGIPDRDQRLPSEGLPAVLRFAWKSRLFQLVQRGVTAARASAAEGTRVSREQFRENVGRLTALEAGGGPPAIFVHEPECAELTLDQLRQVVRRAKAVGAESVLAPRVLLTWIAPAPSGADLVGVRIDMGGRVAIRFEGLPDIPYYSRVDGVRPVGEVEADLEFLEVLKQNFDAILAGLPPESLGYADFFGERPPEEVLADNCHLTVEGARLVGRRMAAEVLARTANRH